MFILNPNLVYFRFRIKDINRYIAKGKIKAESSAPWIPRNWNYNFYGETAIVLIGHWGAFHKSVSESEITVKISEISSLQELSDEFFRWQMPLAFLLDTHDSMATAYYGRVFPKSFLQAHDYVRQDDPVTK